MVFELEFPWEIPIAIVGKETLLNPNAPKEVRAARNRVVRHTPQRKPTTQTWHGKELPICRAFCETTLSIAF